MADAPIGFDSVVVDVIAVFVVAVTVVVVNGEVATADVIVALGVSISGVNDAVVVTSAVVCRDPSSGNFMDAIYQPPVVTSLIQCRKQIISPQRE